MIEHEFLYNIDGTLMLLTVWCTLLIIISILMLDYHSYDVRCVSFAGLTSRLARTGV